MIDLELKTIPHEEQRYDTVGDYFEKDGILRVRVSSMSDPRYEWLVAIHELVEKCLCDWQGISNKTIDDFDRAHEKESVEPGDLPDAPYRDEHCFATAVERLLAAAMGVSWSIYDQELTALSEEQNEAEKA